MRTYGRKGVNREREEMVKERENFLRKSSQTFGSSENALRLGVSFPLGQTLYL